MIAAFTPSSLERPADPLPAPGRNATPGSPSGPRFADLLQRGQATHGVLTHPAPAAPTPVADAAHQPRAEAKPEAPTRPAQPAPSRAALAKGGAKPAPPAHEKAAAATPATKPGAAPSSGDEVSNPTATDAGAAPRPPEGMPAATALPNTLVDWRALVKGSDGYAVAPDAEATAAATVAADRVASHNGSAPGALSAVDPRADASQQPDPARMALTAAVRAAEFLAPAAAVAADERPARSEAPAAGDSLAGSFAGAVSASSRGAEPPAPAAIALATPVESPAFAQVLGAQVSVLARDGVQRAELHLNPAEMGPISVQIEVVGQEARVDFGADMLATRHLIESGLPELAAALREQGFTLAGGGVFQHAPEPRRPAFDDGGPGRATRRAVTDEASTVRGLPRRAPQGMLDLYA